jgi:hypothetical protein
MKLSNFEQFLDDRILQRGFDYFHNGQVVSLETSDDRHYRARVDGSEVYKVAVFLNQAGEIVDTDCDCPYDLGVYCKHQAAVFYALKNEESEGLPTSLVKEADLKSALVNQQKDDLIDIILELSEEYPEIEKRLLFKYAETKDEIAASKKLIREYINNAKRGGFIDWRHVDQAVQGAELTLEKAREKIKRGATESAVQLSLIVLTPVIKMLQYCDDSDGTAGMVMGEAINTIDTAVTTNIHQLNDKEQKKLFDSIIKEALKEQYDGWTDWRFSLLNVCTHFSKNRDLRVKLEKQLELLYKKADQTWSGEYDKAQVKLMQLIIIEKNDSEEAIEKFIYENIHFSDFREKAITNEFTKGNYEKVILLCKDGETADKATSPGLVKRWKEHRFQAYKMLGDVEKQRKLARELLYPNSFQYYIKLKELYPANEWEEVLKTMLEEFEKKPDQPSVYLDIIKEENLTSNILEFCKNHLSSITDLFPYLMENHLEGANQLFIQFIEISAQKATDRSGYKKVCSYIKIYKKAFGIIHSHKIIGELKQKYPRRPAFIDELGKIK